MAGSAWFVATKQTTKSPDCPLGGSCSDEKQIPPPLRWRTDRGQSRHQRHTTTRTAVSNTTTNKSNQLSQHGNSREKKHRVSVRSQQGTDCTLFPFELHWSLMSGKTVSLTRQLRLSLSPEYFTPWCNSCHWKIFPSFWKAKVSMPQDWFLWRNVHLLAVPNYSTEKLPASPPEDRVHDLRSTPALCSQLLPVSRCPLTPQQNGTRSFLRLLWNSSTLEISQPASVLKAKLCQI